MARDEFRARRGSERRQPGAKEIDMGRIVVTEFISLDGVIEDPGGAEGYEHGGWTFKFDAGPEFEAFKFQELQASDAQLLGRVTYDGFAKAWPTIEAGEFGVKMNEMPKYVVSTTLVNPEWNNTTVIRDNVAGEVRELKQRYEGDILVAGSAELVQYLVENDLVDELRLMVFPVLLGRGKRLFGDTTVSRRLQLADTKPLGDGVTILTYRPAESA
jgi:dihydrofolate reductase